MSSERNLEHITCSTRNGERRLGGQIRIILEVWHWGYVIFSQEGAV